MTDLLLDTLFDNAPFFFSIKNVDGTFIYINKPYQEWLGISKTELIGKPARNIWLDGEHVTPLLEADNKVISTGKPQKLESHLKNFKGSQLDQLLFKFPVGYNAGVISSIGTISIDITDKNAQHLKLLESEELFRHAFDYAPNGIALISVDGERLRVNQALADFLGYSIDEISNTSISSNSKDLESLNKSIKLRQRVIDGELQTYTNKRTFKHKDGHTVHGEITASLVRDEKSDPLYFVAHTIDATENEKIKSDLIEAKEKAERANTAKTEFQATVNHELRTPLTSLHGALGLLSGTFSDTLSKEGNVLLDIALRNSEKLLGLVNDLLNYEKIINGNATFDLKKTDLNTLLYRSVENNQSFATEHLTKYLYEENISQIYINVEAPRFEQIMTNLLSNAAKFTSKNTNVTITCIDLGDQAEVKVTDQGIGISERNLDRIFDRFTQVDSTDSRATGGTGLGLAITKSLVEGMGGSIRVESKIGHGSSFIISFPKA